jgi:uncharacterized protein DUF6702
MGEMARMRSRTFRLTCAALVLISRPVLAHPIHTTLTIVASDASHHILTLRIRVFADDFSASVARFAGRRAPADSSAPPGDVLRYVRSKISVIDAHGTPTVLEACGVTRQHELYWLCFTSRPATGTAGVLVQNQMLAELHGDQVNIVQVERGVSARTFLFTRGSPPVILP